MPVLLGTSGWHYQHWRGGFYPPRLASRLWLEYYSQRFAAVELNNAFYRLPEREAFGRWAEQVPDGFCLAVKASRYLTHIRRLKDPGPPVRLLMERASGLGHKLGPILIQLPPNLRADPQALDTTLAAFPHGVKVAVEPRHESWFASEARAVLENRGAALCLADGGPLKSPIWCTASWGYIRFHRGRAHPESCYGRTALETWAKKLAETWDASATVYAFFNNDAHGCAVRDAVTFASALKRSGLKPTAVPSRGEIGQS